MRFHLPALPGRPVAAENSHCAYSQKVRKFAQMMEGHEVFIYEHPGEALPFEPHLWAEANADQAERINANLQEGDFLGIIAGECQRSLAEAVPLMAVEYGVGYGGVFTDFRVFESYAWMHTVYGSLYGTHTADGRFFDAVIPNYFDVDEFPHGEGGDYLLYLGRMVHRKGAFVAAEIAEAAGMPLVLAGEGEEIPDYGEHVGSVGPSERAELLGGARALLSPTLYVEPFGGAVIEANLCGTPAITTDFGAFTETVRNRHNGYRCHLLRDFVEATEKAGELDREAIRSHAIANYSLEAIAPRYEDYFKRLETLRGAGWYVDHERSAV